MGKRGDWPWPPRSPDLAIYDFFFWAYLKQQIWNVPHEQQPRNCSNISRHTSKCKLGLSALSEVYLSETACPVLMV